MKRLFLVTLTLSLLLTACGITNSQAEKAAKAMAETSCLIFNDAVAIENIPAQSEQIITGYGWENALAIDDYLESIDGTSEKNEVAVLVRQHLDDTCGEQLEAGGLNAAELAEAIIFE